MILYDVLVKDDSAIVYMKLEALTLGDLIVKLFEQGYQSDMILFIRAADGWWSWRNPDGERFGVDAQERSFMEQLLEMGPGRYEIGLWRGMDTGKNFCKPPDKSVFQSVPETALTKILRDGVESTLRDLLVKYAQDMAEINKRLLENSAAIKGLDARVTEEIRSVETSVEELDRKCRKKREI